MFDLGITHTLDPWGWVKMSFQVVTLHIKLKAKSVDQHVSKTIDLTHTPDLCGWVERSDVEL